MIPDHIKIGDAKKLLSEFISNNNFSKVGFLVDENSKKHCLKPLQEYLSFNYDVITIRNFIFSHDSLYCFC